MVSLLALLCFSVISGLNDFVLLEQFIVLL